MFGWMSGLMKDQVCMCVICACAFFVILCLDCLSGYLCVEYFFVLKLVWVSVCVFVFAF